MSRENVEMVYRGIEAFNKRDLDAFIAVCDPGVEFYSRLLEVEGGGPYRGQDGVRAWWGDLLRVWRDVSGEIEEVRDLGEVTVTRVRLRGHGMDSDAPWEQTQWHVAEWRNKKTIWIRTFLSEAEALEAAGLKE